MTSKFESSHLGRSDSISDAPEKTQQLQAARPGLSKDLLGRMIAMRKLGGFSEELQENPAHQRPANGKPQ
jgi:hypothetical protein